MQTITNIKNLRANIKSWRQAGLSIAFIPTMGNLHAGHLELIKAAKYKADKVVVSIFVNPTQFGEHEDFDAYPRTEQQDAQQLAGLEVDLLFLPSIAEIYHQDAKTRVLVNDISQRHCGASRTGHFDGVATVVCKLFNLVQPDMAFFGEKDFQQLAIIRLMVRDLNMPIKIDGLATVREGDGLAMSSRNGYLTPEQRLIAPKLYQALESAKKAVLSQQQNHAAVEQQRQQFLESSGFEVDYFSICNRNDLTPAKPEDKELVILAAAKLGQPRLIDNICVDLN